ncbi:lysine transporter LysE [Aureimonas sp. Leaf454]|uniref:LysE family translocator n=1 Tax=Aureimonas sp. Leaf454 TaxID=1736381 RepID=UPI000701921A|nr:LysE family translocator [Aureimonas sp. Leaf454]KQT50858.1 lysine transporter LysE [Aureimonas sp. Leaf454]
MPLETFLALIVYAFVTSVTPGPNNMMLMASGVNFGFKRTLPHMLGIALGFFVLLLSVGFGLGAVLLAVPAAQTALKIASVAYMVWLAWKVAMSRSIGEGTASAKPLTLLEAAAFQWVNPKAWAMALVAMGAYTNADHPVLSVVLVGVAFAVVNFPSVSVWAGFGVALRGYLADPRRLRVFNGLMGLALLLSIVPILF